MLIVTVQNNFEWSRKKNYDCDWFRLFIQFLIRFYLWVFQKMWKQPEAKIFNRWEYKIDTGLAYPWDRKPSALNLIDKNTSMLVYNRLWIFEHYEEKYGRKLSQSARSIRN